MLVNKIQNNNIPSYKSNVNSVSFSGGISCDLAKKVLSDGAKFSDVFEKSKKIADVNKDIFILSDGIYNLKDKSAEFVLSAVKQISFIPGLENVKPRTLKVKGSSLKDAFQNINKDELSSLNKVLENDYKTRYIETKDFRNEVYAKMAASKAELERKYLLADSFWINYYKSMPNRNK